MRTKLQGRHVVRNHIWTPLEPLDADSQRVASPKEIHHFYASKLLAKRPNSMNNYGAPR